jgi:hypothetical protein
VYSTSFAVGAVLGIALAGALAVAATPKPPQPEPARAEAALYRYGVPELRADFAASEATSHPDVPLRQRQD